MKWRKSPKELVKTFESVMPGAPAAMRKMFGFPAGFIHGNMFMGLHQGDMILRLSEGQWDHHIFTHRSPRHRLKQLRTLKMQAVPREACLLCKIERSSVSGSARR